MAQARSKRPLSPHLQIWRWGPAMTISILHRIAGNGMVFVGLPLLLWWLGAIASGPEAYANFASWVWTGQEGSALKGITSVLGKIALVGLSWAFFQHLSSGIRHFFLDIGAGYDVDQNNRWSLIAILIGVLLTVVFWLVALKV
jgi:succinate dehydrogenase / fumarate reductase cytochrome b subunit